MSLVESRPMMMLPDFRFLEGRWKLIRLIAFSGIEDWIGQMDLSVSAIKGEL